MIRLFYFFVRIDIKRYLNSNCIYKFILVLVGSMLLNFFCVVEYYV